LRTNTNYISICNGTWPILEDSEDWVLKTSFDCMQDYTCDYKSCWCACRSIWVNQKVINSNSLHRKWPWLTTSAFITPS